MTDTAIKILTAPLGKTHLFFLGQAGFAIKSKSGRLLGIDLYLSSCVERVEGHVGYKRLQPAPMYPGEIGFDYLIATHPHKDHFDMDAIPIMMDNGRTQLLASVECKGEVDRLMICNDRVRYVKTGDVIELDDFRVRCVYCDHGTGAPDAFGLVITVDGMRIFIAGDTSLHLEKVPEFTADGEIDVMIAPINGAYGNLNETECAALAGAVRPGLVIPCHYGMFASHGGNPGKFLDVMKEEYPNQQFLLMAIGESLTLEG